MRLRSALALLAALVVICEPAMAVTPPTGSTITAPGNRTVRIDDGSSLTIAGTTSGGDGNVDIRCYFGTGSVLVAADVPVVASAFTFTGSVHGAAGETCVLRAVPAGSFTLAPPSGTSPFAGPLIQFGYVDYRRVPNGPNAGALAGFDVMDAQFSGGIAYDDIGNCGIEHAYPYDVDYGFTGVSIFDCGPYLPSTDPSDASRTALTVDGNDVYLGDAAQGAWVDPVDATRNSSTNAGFPAVDMSYSLLDFGDMTLNDSPGLAFCEPTPNAVPPTSTTCSSFSPSGVALTRTITQDHFGYEARINDVWTSTDGRDHLIDADYDSHQSQNPGNGGIRITWSGSPNAYLTQPDDTGIAPPLAVPAALYLKHDTTAPNNDPSNPLGAIVLAAPPTSIVLKRGTSGSENELVFRYARTVPANGSLSLRFAYIHGVDEGLVEQLVNEAQTTIAGPELILPPPPSAPPPEPPAPLPVPPAGHVAKDRTPPTITIRIKPKQKLGNVLRKGLVASIRCSEKCTFNARLLLKKKRIGGRRGSLRARQTKAILLPVSKAAQKQLRRARRAQFTVRVTARDAAGNAATRSRSATVKR